jgi:hypothetical protein
MAAVGSIVQSQSTHRTVKSLSLVWTSDAAGAVSGIQSGDVDGELLGVVFKPGAAGVQPTNAYDITLLDADGFDVLAGLGADLSNATATRVSPLIGNGVTTNQRAPLSGSLQLVVANAGNAKSGTVTIYYR